MVGVESGINADIRGHSREDEEEGVRNERGWRLGEAKRISREEGLGKERRRDVVGDGEAGSYTYNMFRPCSPPLLVYLPADELVENSVVHLLGGVLDVVGQIVLGGVLDAGKEQCNGDKEATLGSDM